MNIGELEEEIIQRHCIVPKTFKMNSVDIFYRTGDKRNQDRLNRRKARNKETSQDGTSVFEIEEELSRNSLVNVNSIEQFDARLNVHTNHRQTLRNFYHSSEFANDVRKFEIQRQKCLDTFCSQERKHSDKNPIMFIGDRGYGVGSRVKGFLKYGGKWKPSKHERYTSVLVTNEFNTSKVCPFCFRFIHHPQKIVRKNDRVFLRLNNGVSICSNENCVLTRTRRNQQPRDSLSALAIGISGASALLLGSYLPPFENKQISQSQTDTINNKAMAFRTRRANRPATMLALPRVSFNHLNRNIDFQLLTALLFVYYLLIFIGSYYF